MPVLPLLVVGFLIYCIARGIAPSDEQDKPKLGETDGTVREAPPPTVLSDGIVREYVVSDDVDESFVLTPAVQAEGLLLYPFSPSDMSRFSLVYREALLTRFYNGLPFDEGGLELLRAHGFIMMYGLDMESALRLVRSGEIPNYIEERAAGSWMTDKELRDDEHEHRPGFDTPYVPDSTVARLGILFNHSIPVDLRSVDSLW